ncbi:MAG: amino acid permease [Acidobacteriaceae bacterium]
MSFKDWLLSDLERPVSAHSGAQGSKHPWWRVMCLTGVDYFSTLGYQSGIAFLAAGVLSPIATLVLVLVTLVAALPVYNQVAAASPYGQGSISMLEKLFPGWTGKIFVLVLLGFATTDFTITMSLSAADAAAHFVHNPYTHDWVKSQMGVTLIILAILGGVFLKGFKEAINIAVVIVAVYLGLNAIVSVVGIYHVLEQPAVIVNWKRALFVQHGSLLSILGISCLLFPRLALGLSGFETGVAVMPLIEPDDLDARIRNTRRLLRTAAFIMSVFLLANSFITTLLIPAADFKEGGPANGRAVAYLAHLYLGASFGTAVDIITILILGFAGASAMAGLLNLIPRYLPGFGMAPEWARTSRPLVLVFTSVAFMVTLLFHASVDAQAGAYATGVLVLITSAAFAVTIAARSWLARAALGVVSLIFIYTTLVNIYERPEGLKISCFFICAMVFMSLVSRAFRSTELRITGIHLDAQAEALIGESRHRTVRLIAWNPRSDSSKDREEAKEELLRLHCLPPDSCIYFVEIERGDTSEFTDSLTVQGLREGSNRILRGRSAVVANSIAALLMHLQRVTGCTPHAYFHWSDINPAMNVLRFVFLGEGETAPLTQEVLRRAIKDPEQRPGIHVD